MMKSCLVISHEIVDILLSVWQPAESLMTNNKLKWAVGENQMLSEPGEGERGQPISENLNVKNVQLLVTPENLLCAQGQIDTCQQFWTDWAGSQIGHQTLSAHVPEWKNATRIT